MSCTGGNGVKVTPLEQVAKGIIGKNGCRGKDHKTRNIKATNVYTMPTAEWAYPSLSWSQQNSQPFTSCRDLKQQQLTSNGWGGCEKVGYGQVLLTSLKITPLPQEKNVAGGNAWSTSYRYSLLMIGFSAPPSKELASECTRLSIWLIDACHHHRSILQQKPPAGLPDSISWGNPYTSNCWISSLSARWACVQS